MTTANPKDPSPRPADPFGEPIVSRTRTARNGPRSGPEAPTQAPTTNAPRSGADGERVDPAAVYLPHSHGRCDVRWAGERTSHCGSCHQTMTSPSAFDAHRNRRTGEGGCFDPATVGMALHTRTGYEVWGFPLDEAASQHFRRLRSKDGDS